MNPRHSAFLVVAVVLAGSAPVGSLERAARRLPKQDDWVSSATVSLAYYNTCTGWVWFWSGFQSGDEFGAVFDLGSATLVSVSQYIYEGFGVGYGHTGSIEIVPVDSAGSPSGAALASQLWAPRDRWHAGNWYTTDWGGLQVSEPFAVRVTWNAGDPVFPNPTKMLTDHPAAGRTGPTACGTCFPSGRLNHSFQWKTSGIQIVPGDPFFDGTCNAELAWTATYVPDIATSVRDESWGAVKALYR